MPSSSRAGAIKNVFVKSKRCRINMVGAKDCVFKWSSSKIIAVGVYYLSMAYSHHAV